VTAAGSPPDPGRPAAAATPTSFGVCYVCTGNICRSPMGEVLLRDRIARRGWADRVWVESAGTMNWHHGNRADPRTIDVLAHHGLDGSAHRARPFLMADLAHLDLVLALDEDHLRLLRTLAPSAEDAAKMRLLRSFDPAAVAAGTLSVDDPFNDGPAGFERAFAEISAATDGVVRYIAAQLGEH